MDLSIATDRIPHNGETYNGYDFLMNPGGKGGNQAVASAKSNAPTYIIARIGFDRFGEILKCKLRESNVNVRYVKQTPIHTGVAVIIRTEQDNRIILENGANHTIHEDEIKDTLHQLVKPGDIFLTQLENNVSAVIAGLKQAKQHGMYTIFNPTPAIVIPNEVFQNIDLFIINQSECEFYTGIYPSDDTTVLEAINYFSNKGCDVIITLGKKGSVAYIQYQRYDMLAYEVETRDTTGAGDTFVGVLCAMLAQDNTFENALQYANAASALCVMQVGAQCAIPSLEEIQKFLEEHH